jgi:hypothetical protein
MDTIENTGKVENTPIQFGAIVDLKAHIIPLTSAEMACLWNTYQQDSAIVCVLKHFSTYVKDSEIKPIVEEALTLCKTRIEQISNIFSEEEFPIPQAFSDKDVHLSAPPLYSELYTLSYVYHTNGITVISFGNMVTKVARVDVLEFFSDALSSTTELYKKALKLMLSKGVYDRPPKFPYPKKDHFIEKQSFLAGWFGDRRPLNAPELMGIFFTVENNYIGLNFLLGLIQVTKDIELKKYLIRGKELSEKQINIFNDVLKKEDLMETVPTTLEVTDSAVSPFSEKLIMFLITGASTAAIYLLGTSLSQVMRRDMAAHYSHIIIDIMQYVEDGAHIMINRGWMEQPPQAPNRRELTH